MATKYDFKLYFDNTLKQWVPVMWAKKKITMRFTAPANWTAVDFKVFQVYPEDTQGLPGSWPAGITTAEKVKHYILAHPNTYANWDPNGDRYCGPNGDPTFEPDPSGNVMKIHDAYNGGKKKHGNGSSVNPVYDFILRFEDDSGDQILVDPSIRNEY